MLKKLELDGCRELLDRLSYADIVSLVDTVTKKLINVTRKSEGVKAILEYTPAALDLLKRKKVKRDVLFMYLVDQKVIVPATINKSSLIRIILQRWGTDLSDWDMDVDLEDDTDSEPVLLQLAQNPRNQPPLAQNLGNQLPLAQNPGNQPPLAQNPGNQPPLAQNPGNQSPLPQNLGNQPPLAQNPGNQPPLAQNPGNQSPLPQNLGNQPPLPQNPGNQPAQFNIHVQQYFNVASVHNADSASMNEVTVHTGVQHGANQSQNGSVSHIDICNASRQLADSDTQILGEKFAEWFYKNLNSHNPYMQKTPGGFGPHHFWDDVYLVLNSHTPQPSEEKLEGAFLVSQRFLAFTKDEYLLFNPNLTQEGICVKSNPHGLVMILVCGTVHRNNECLGVFQQLFGIVKDPRFENNWKIKMTKLEVKTSHGTTVPKLEGNLDSQIQALVAV